MLRALHLYLKTPNLSELQALNVLRLVYTLTFMAQVAVAAVLAGVMAVILGRQSSGVMLAQIFVALSVVQLPLALLLSVGVSRPGGKQAALSASIMSGVLLSTPAWFTAMTFLVSSTFLYLALLFVVLLIYYALGVILCGRWAKVALSPGKELPNKELPSKELPSKELPSKDLSQTKDKYDIN